MTFHAVNSPAVRHTWVLVYRGTSGYTRIPISQGKTNVTQTAKARGVDKTRNMEHPGTFRNIPEHEKIKIFFFMKK